MKESRLLAAVLAFLVISASVTAKAASIVSYEYLPLADGNTWTYSVDGLSSRAAIVSPGSTLINGVATKGVQFTDGSIQSIAVSIR